MNALLWPVLLGSVAGSLHCAAMCGPFAASVGGFARNERGGYTAHAAYHAGRLLTYLTLGGTAALLGQALDLAGKSAGVSRVSAVVAGALLVVFGLSTLAQDRGLVTLRRRPMLRLGTILGHVLSRMRDLPVVPRAALLGLSTTLVPCGWLYAFVAAAAASGEVVSGVGIMAAFWLGTVPALVVAGIGVGKLVKRFGAHARAATASLMVATGVVVLVLRAAGPVPGDAATDTAKTPASCPLHPH
jgi:sulfite exporter TauE/SafE